LRIAGLPISADRSAGRGLLRGERRDRLAIQGVRASIPTGNLALGIPHSSAPSIEPSGSMYSAGGSRKWIVVVSSSESTVLKSVISTPSYLRPHRSLAKLVMRRTCASITALLMLRASS
jgi:hypothetical protein